MTVDYEFNVEITYDGGDYRVTGRADVVPESNYPWPGETTVCHWWKAERIDPPDGETEHEAWRKANFVKDFRQLVIEAVERQYETATPCGHEPCDAKADG